MVSEVMSEAKRRRIDPLKVVFALGYMLQGLANPFQGITYQSFYRHLHVHYGLSEGDTQRLFAKSYLAWSFKPIIGFLIDAYGRTRTLLLGLLGFAALGYLVTPLLDTGPIIFFALMFALSVVLAGTDVAIDRATVIAGDEEAKTTGRSKATTVGLNQAICWLAVYGTLIVSAIAGGYVADHVPFKGLLVGLAVVPLAVLAAVLRLPRDRAVTIPLRRSVAEFWRGLNSGPVLGVLVFYFVFFFQPAVGTIWTDYQLRDLGFSQSQAGWGDSAGYTGSFIGVLLFAWKGVKWQERLGLRKLFGIFIVVSAVLSLARYLLIDPTFSAITGRLHAALPFLDRGTVRLGFLCTCNVLLAIGDAVIRMSTFSVAGAVIPVAVESRGLWTAIMTILPHGILELPAIFLGTSIGISLGLHPLARLRGKTELTLFSELGHALRIYLSVIIPLLLIAAAVEVFVTPLVAGL
jgi:MFS family permease